MKIYFLIYFLCLQTWMYDFKIITVIFIIRFLYLLDSFIDLENIEIKDSQVLWQNNMLVKYWVQNNILQQKKVLSLFVKIFDEKSPLALRLETAENHKYNSWTEKFHYSKREKIKLWSTLFYKLFSTSK